MSLIVIRRSCSTISCTLSMFSGVVTVLGGPPPCSSSQDVLPHLKHMKPSFDYAVRHSRFLQSCRHIFMNFRRRHPFLLKVFNNSSLLNRLHSVLTLHPMSFKHLLRSNTNIHRLATWHIAITHIKDLCGKKSVFLFN